MVNTKLLSDVIFLLEDAGEKLMQFNATQPELPISAAYRISEAHSLLREVTNKLLTERLLLRKEFYGTPNTREEYFRDDYR